MTGLRMTPRRWSAVAAVLILLVAGGVTLHVADDRYGPLGPGGFGGPLGLRRHGDGLLTLDHGHGGVFFAVGNAGAHAVQVTSIDGDGAVAAARWSAYRFVPGGYISGEPEPWRRFPATVPAHGTIRVRFALQRPPDCSQYRIAGRNWTTRADVHWESLLHDHTTRVPVFDDFQFDPCR